MYFTNPTAPGLNPSLAGVNPAVLWQQLLSGLCSNLGPGPTATLPASVSPADFTPPLSGPFGAPSQFSPYNITPPVSPFAPTAPVPPVSPFAPTAPVPPFSGLPPSPPPVPIDPVTAIGGNLTAFTAGLEVGALIGAALTGALRRTPPTVAGVATAVPTGAIPPAGALPPVYADATVAGESGCAPAE